MRKTKRFYESIKLTPHEHLLFAKTFEKPKPKWTLEFTDLYGYCWNEDSGLDEDDHVFVYDEGYEKWIRRVTDDCEQLISRVNSFTSDLFDYKEDEIDYFSWVQNKQLKYLIDNNSDLKKVDLITLIWYMSSVSYVAVFIPYYEFWIIYEDGDVGDDIDMTIYDKNIDLKEVGVSFTNSGLHQKYVEFGTKADQAFDGLIKFDELNLLYRN